MLKDVKKHIKSHLKELLSNRFIIFQFVNKQKDVFKKNNRT
jgi:hypothetical protein